MKSRWVIGMAIMVAAGLLGGILFAALTTGPAQAYNGPGGNNVAQTQPQTTPTTGPQPGYGPGGGRGMLGGNGPMMGNGRGPGNGSGNGPGGGPMMGMGSSGGCLNVPTSNTKLDDKTVAALTEALNDEYENRALYQAVIDKHGAVWPFQMIVRSEGMHVQALQRLFTAHGLAIPADNSAAKVKGIDVSDLKAAYKLGIDQEKANVAMYDKLLKTVSEPDVVTVFNHLKYASENMHLKAFETAYNR